MFALNVIGFLVSLVMFVAAIGDGAGWVPSLIWFVLLVLCTWVLWWGVRIRQRGGLD